MYNPSTGDSDDDELSHQSNAPEQIENAETAMQSLPNDFRSALDEFRNNWQKELKGDSGHSTPLNEKDFTQAANESVDILKPLPKVETENVDPQILAESLFQQAVEFEQRGKAYDALPLYRKAMQIIPDIEFKYYERQKNKPAFGNVDNSARQTPAREDTYNTDDYIDNLYEKFQMDLASEHNGRLLLSNRDAGVISTEMHISNLPPEILLFILRWVVSAQLDMRSLEQCAAVCKGMYLCARDEELWRLACVKVWGSNVGTLENPTAQPNSELTAPDTAPIASFSSWRQMFIERDRVLFNGCYISKTTYLRMGENSFQDQFYRPVQLVEYYRYVRFLPDGTVFMMTTADEPAQGVGKLKNLHQVRSDVLRGRYRLYGNTITIIMHKQKTQRGLTSTHQFNRPRRGSTAGYGEEHNNTKYCIEFRIVSTIKRRFVQLAWHHYSVVQTRNKVETSSEFDLKLSKYPPLWFSPVRSYHLDADAPLA